METREWETSGLTAMPGVAADISHINTKSKVRLIILSRIQQELTKCLGYRLRPNAIWTQGVLDWQ
jgi:hypothetical protein